MQEIPIRKIGDKVRIMQTDEMVNLGLANMIGVVIKIRGTSNYRGQDCDIELNGGRVERIWASSLMGA
jgi:hypothetical protein